MKISLPNNKTPKGFTLIELLIVIAIIAILSIIGFAAFRNIGANRNDARRTADLKAIGDALEVNKTTSGYQVLANSQFASGSVPVDPTTSTAVGATYRNYCITYSNAVGATLANGAQSTTVLGAAQPGTWANAVSPGSCPAAGSGFSTSAGISSDFTLITTSTPIVNSIAWKICATLDGGGTPVVSCRNHAQ